MLDCILIKYSLTLAILLSNCNIIYEGEQLLIYLVRPTTKEEKITQYDANTDKTVLV